MYPISCGGFLLFVLFLVAVNSFTPRIMISSFPSRKVSVRWILTNKLNMGTGTVAGDRLKNFAKFVEVLCKPKSVITVDPFLDLAIRDSNVQQIPLMNALKEKDSLVELRFPNKDLSGDATGREPLIRANILPIDMYWPFFGDNKQKAAILKNVVFQRCGMRDFSTITDSMRLLNEQKDVLIFGNPGIGKTTSMNIMLMLLVDQIRQLQTDIRTVIVRLPSFSFRLTYTEKPSKSLNESLIYLEEQKFEIEHIQTNKRLEDWEAYRESGGATVILADVGEKEENPHFACSVNGILTLSLGDIKNEAKTLWKVPTLPCLVEPPSTEEVEAVSRIMYRMIHHDAKAMTTVLSPEQCVTNEQDFVDIIYERTKVVGRLLRSIYSYLGYRLCLAEIASFNPTLFWENCLRLNTRCLAPGMSSILGSYFKDGVQSSEFDESAVEIRAHSDALARRVALMITQFSQWQLIGQQFTTLAYQLQESAMMAHGVLYNFASEEVCKMLGEKAARFDAWEFYRDSEIQASLAKAPWCNAAGTELKFPNCTKVSFFPAVLLKSRIKDLSDNYAHRSSKVNRRLVDAKSISHEHKLVFLWQCTEQDPADHSIKLSTLEEVVRNLGLLEVGEESSKYAVKFLMVTSKHNDPLRQHGMRFTLDNGATTTLQGIISKIHKCKLDPAFASFLKTRFEAWVVRAPFLPNMPEIVSPGGAEVNGYLDKLKLNELEALCCLCGMSDIGKPRSTQKFLGFMRSQSDEAVRAKLQLHGSSPLTVDDLPAIRELTKKLRKKNTN